MEQPREREHASADERPDSGESSGASSPLSTAAPAAEPESAPLLLFDLGGFHEVQDAGEADALARQLMLCYSSNRRAPAPFRLALCGLAAARAHEAGAPGQRLLRTLDGMNFRRWGPPGWVTIHEEPPWEAFPDRRLVYLSADAPEPLMDIQCGQGAEAYVIGGVVDRVRKPGASLQRAQSAGLASAALPTAGVFDTPAKPDALSCLGCVQTMLAFHGVTRPNWGDAFVAAPAMWCAPLRKYIVWRGSYSHLNKPGAYRGRPHNITG
eukprot:jgi/Tetstr1/433643/TSEL_000013.t1